MREAGVHHSGSRLERPRVAEGGPHEQHRVDATIRRWSGGNTSRGLLCDSQECQRLNLAQTFALRARQLRLALQHVDRNRALELADAGWHGQCRDPIDGTHRSTTKLTSEKSASDEAPWAIAPGVNSDSRVASSPCLIAAATAWVNIAHLISQVIGD